MSKPNKQMEAVKARNFKTVTAMRKKNKMEQKRLHHEIYKPCGLEANHRLSMENLARETQNLKHEMARIQKTTYLTRGSLPPRRYHKGSDTGLEDTLTVVKATGTPMATPRASTRRESIQEDLQKQNKEEARQVQEKLKDFTDKLQARSTTDVSPYGASPRVVNGADDEIAAVASRNRPRALSLANINLQLAQNQVARRLSLSDRSEEPIALSPRVGKGALLPVVASVPEEENTQDSSSGQSPSPKLSRKSKKGVAEQDEESDRMQAAEMYHPDGHLRTVHQMPDFTARWCEARKARYVRHRDKQLHEKELTGADIFPKDSV